MSTNVSYRNLLTFFHFCGPQANIHWVDNTLQYVDTSGVYLKECRLTQSPINQPFNIQGTVNNELIDFLQFEPGHSLKISVKLPVKLPDDTPCENKAECVPSSSIVEFKIGPYTFPWHVSRSETPLYIMPGDTSGYQTVQLPIQLLKVLRASSVHTSKGYMDFTTHEGYVLRIKGKYNVVPSIYVNACHFSKLIQDISSVLSVAQHNQLTIGIKPQAPLLIQHECYYIFLIPLILPD